MRAEKQSMAAEMRTKVKESGFVFLADYQGLSVAKTNELKRRLRGVQASMQVVKNRMFGHVARDLGFKQMGVVLDGPSAMVFGQDPVGAAKVLKDFIKEHQKPVLKLGSLGTQALTLEDINALAALPSRHELLGKMVGTLAAPMSQLVGVINAKLTSLLYVLKAIEDKKAKSNG